MAALATTTKILAPKRVQGDAGHRYGNFPNYYSFHGVDDRLDCISDEFIINCFQLSTQQNDDQISGCSEYTICDIGCNDGTFTQKLHERIARTIKKFHPIDPRTGTETFCLRTLGMELDAMLIERAKTSKEVPLLGLNSSISFETVDVSNSELVSHIVGGFLSSNKTQFNLVTCFSTTMWVHINHGDAAMKLFLNQLASFSTNIIIEPQPWKCYRNAATRLRRQGLPPLTHFNDILARSNKGVEDLITDAICYVDMEAEGGGCEVRECFTHEVLAEAAGSWKRRFIYFKRNNH